MVNRRQFLTTIAAGGTMAGMPARAAADGRCLETPAGKIPVAGTYDLVVAGGSTTGVAAAVTAARAGLSVALVEYNAFFGGTATAGLVPVWHSLYSTDGKQQIIGGITDEIEKRLLARGEARVMGRTDKSVGCYLNVAALEIVLDELVREAKTVVPYLKAQVTDAVLDRPGHLTHVVIEDRDGRRALAARQFIDATGDAVLAVRAGFKTLTQPRSDIQAHTLCAILSGVNAIRKVHPSFSFDKFMGPSGGAGLKHVFQWSAPVIGAPGLTFLAATRISACDPSVARDLTEGLFEGRAQLKRIVDAANRMFPMPEGKRLALVAVAPDMGIRESRHIEAQYRVTSKDVLYGRHFDDCIAKGSYRVDIHEGSGITLRYLNGEEHRMEATPEGKVRWRRGRWRTDEGPYPTWYEIPMRALRPVGAENLHCAGRMIDCEREAYGALRVMVNCNQMGEAAGRAVACAVKGSAAKMAAFPVIV